MNFEKLRKYCEDSHLETSINYLTKIIIIYFRNGPVVFYPTKDKFSKMGTIHYGIQRFLDER
jgi:hypothetical protein